MTDEGWKVLRTIVTNGVPFWHNEDGWKVMLRVIKCQAIKQHAPDALLLREALEKALNFIENTEGELGITLACGEAARAALKGQRP